MEPDMSKIVDQSSIALTFTDFHMHQFIEGNKKKVAEGNCIILEWSGNGEQQHLYYIKMNNFDFCKLINSNLFIRVTYPKSTSYIFFSQFEENVTYVISVANQSPQKGKFQETLVKHGNLLDYESPELTHDTKVRVEFHCGKIKQNQPMINFTTSAKIGNAIGKVFGFINQKVDRHLQNAGKAVDQRVTRFSRESLSEGTRSKWTGVKEKASELNGKLTQLVRPIGTKIGEVTSNIKESVKNSQNTYIKGFRQFTTEAQNSINEGYDKENAAEKKEDSGNSMQQKIEKEVEDPSLNEKENQKQSLLH